MEKCPKCNDEGGFYVNLIASYTQFYDFAGIPTDATAPMTIRGGQVAYCENCHKRLGRFVYGADGYASIK